MSKRKTKPLPRTKPQTVNKKALIWAGALSIVVIIAMTILLIFNT